MLQSLQKQAIVNQHVPFSSTEQYVYPFTITDGNLPAKLLESISTDIFNKTKAAVYHLMEIENI